jgi:hypothetical protein
MAYKGSDTSSNRTQIQDVKYRFVIDMQTLAAAE